VVNFNERWAMEIIAYLKQVGSGALAAINTL